MMCVYTFLCHLTKNVKENMDRDFTVNLGMYQNGKKWLKDSKQNAATDQLALSALFFVQSDQCYPIARLKKLLIGLKIGYDNLF